MWTRSNFWGFLDVAFELGTVIFTPFCAGVRERDTFLAVGTESLKEQPKLALYCTGCIAAITVGMQTPGIRIFQHILEVDSDGLPLFLCCFWVLVLGFSGVKALLVEK